MFCVGNGFIRSGRRLISMVRWMVTGSNFFPTMIHSTYLDKNVTEAECINAFPTKKHRFTSLRTLVVVEPFGTHECVPYAKFGALPLDEPGCLSKRAECINAFPTKRQFSYDGSWLIWEIFGYFVIFSCFTLWSMMCREASSL